MLPTVVQEVGAGGEAVDEAEAGHLRDIVARHLGVIAATRVVTRHWGSSTAIAGVGVLKVWTSWIRSEFDVPTVLSGVHRLHRAPGLVQKAEGFRLRHCLPYSDRCVGVRLSNIVYVGN